MKYKFKTRPYAHQRRALKRMLALVRSGLAGGALLMEPRTGKTKVAIDFASILAQHGKIRKVLVIAPPKPAVAVWPDQIMKHCPLLYEIVIWGDARIRKQTTLGQPAPQTQLQFVILNYNALAAPGRVTKRSSKGAILKRSRATGGRYTIKKQLRKWLADEPALCILDESHKIKSPGARASNAVVNLGPWFRYRMLLTGTPVTKKKRVFDVYMQWKFLNEERFSHVPTSADFKNHYGRWLNQGFPLWVGEKNIDELRDLVHRDSFAITRDECFDLPAPSRKVELVTLGPNAARVYDEMATQLVATLKNGRVVEASIPLVQALRLAQITSGIAKGDDGRAYRVGREKLEALESYLDDAKEREEKIVVTARFRPDLAAIRNLAAKRFKLPVFVLAGGMNNTQVAREIAKFQTMDGGAVYVVQPNSGSLGIDLSAASRLVWYSLTPSWVDYSQMTDRIALNPDQTEIVYLLAENTVDEEQLIVLDDDGKMAKLVTTRPEKLLRSVPGTISSMNHGPGKVVEL